MKKRVRPPVWLWFNLLSLDAPLIALVWQDFLSRCYPTLLRPTGRGALGLTVWAIYLADRLLDVRHPASAMESIRHRFYRQHRGYVIGLLAMIVCGDALLTTLWLRPQVFNEGLVLSACVVLYLAVFAFAGWSGLAKKPLAAILFTFGTFLITWTGAGHSLYQLLWPAVGFCALCLGNLWMIGRWSRHAAPSAREWVAPVLLCACLMGGLDSTWFTAIMLSAAALAVLARWGRTISGDFRCVLADAVLLTPLLFR